MRNKIQYKKITFYDNIIQGKYQELNTLLLEANILRVTKDYRYVPIGNISKNFHSEDVCNTTYISLSPQGIERLKDFLNKEGDHTFQSNQVIYGSKDKRTLSEIIECIN